MRGPLFSHKISIFLGITLLLVALPTVQVMRTGEMGSMVLLLMWAPGLAAILTQLITTRSLAGLGWRLGNWRYLLTSFLIPLGICIVVYGLLWGVGVIPFTAAELRETVAQATGLSLSLPLALLLTLAVIFPLSFLTALGEEIGWRGLLLPELAKRYDFTVAVLISALIWAIYHYPAILFADYHSRAPIWFGLPMFTLSIVGFSFATAWLRLKSGSLWTAVLLHASHNFFVQAVFDPMTLDFGLTPYLTTEFGVGLAIAYALVALYFWRRRGEAKTNTSFRA